MRVLAYLWAAPTTALGLVAALLAVATGGWGSWRRGVLEVAGGLAGRGLLALLGAQAVTLGHVVLGRDDRCLDRCRAHERAHVRQAERWGPLFLPAYFLAGLWGWARGRRFYLDNPFERDAERRSASPH